MYPFQLAITPTAIKAYLIYFLLSIVSTILMSTSNAAWGLFYYNYIPQKDLSGPLYIQYAAGTHPRAEYSIKSNVLISQQPYDISIILNMPRTPTNIAAGNFMLDLTLHGSGSSLHHSRRPAILPYSSKITDLATTFLNLPFYLVGARDLNSIILTIPMFEELQFARGRDNIPTHVELEVRTQTAHDLQVGSCPPQPQLQIYSAEITFHCRFRGLRYLVYNYRYLAAFIFPPIFYVTSFATLIIVWALITVPKWNHHSFVKSSPEQPNIKSEPETSDRLKTESDNDISIKVEKQTPALSDRDIPTTFPALGRNAKPLQYNPQASEPPSAPPSYDQAAPVQEDNDHQAHADDEDEESEDEWQQLQRIRERMAKEAQARQRQMRLQMQHDSGIGTSLESENTTIKSEPGLVRRRSQREQ